MFDNFFLDFDVNSVAAPSYIRTCTNTITIYISMVDNVHFTKVSHVMPYRMAGKFDGNKI